MSKITFILNWSKKAKSKLVLSGKSLHKATAYVCGPNIEAVERKYADLCKNIMRVVGPYFPIKVIGCKKYRSVVVFNESHVRPFVNYVQRICINERILPSDSLLLAICHDTCKECEDYDELILKTYKLCCVERNIEKL